VPALLAEVEALVSASYPDFEIVWFGHIGDGNVHLNILKPDDLSQDEFQQRCGESVSVGVFEAVARHGGSISAEHGVGLLKKPYLRYSRSAAELALMRGMKRVFDPAGILNPGKLLDALMSCTPCSGAAASSSRSAGRCRETGRCRPPRRCC
jgi:FAD/FMN-containing dehydrogenase